MSQSVPKTPLIAPFRGLRYTVSDLSSRVCPPYDVISPSQREELYRLDPQNAIRLEFPLPRGSQDCYQAAAQDWREWRHGGVLREDDESLYLCRTDFVYQGKQLSRFGFLAGLHLEALGSGRVLPHEGTLAAPKADRLAMLQATQANFSPIWAIYENPSLPELLRQACSGPPASQADLPDGSRIFLWPVSDRALLEEAAGRIGDGPVFIADGHHRYETALSFAQQHLGESETAPVNYLLSLLVEAGDPGLIILPTHRALAGLTEEEMGRLWQHLRECCRLEQFEDFEELIKEIYAGEYRFGLYTKQDGCRLLLLKEPEASPTQAAANAPVALLHRRILDPVFGGEVKFGYYKEAQEAKAAVDSGEYSAAFFLRPLRVQELTRAARSRERLPGKSTYFWPKVPAGLVMRSLR